jgi:hypothetical protein
MGRATQGYIPHQRFAQARTLSPGTSVWVLLAGSLGEHLGA